MTDDSTVKITLNRAQLAQFFSASPQAVKAFEQLFITANSSTPGTVIDITIEGISDSGQLSETQALFNNLLAELLGNAPPLEPIPQLELFAPPVSPAEGCADYAPPLPAYVADAYAAPNLPQETAIVYVPPYCLDLNSEMTSWLSSLPTAAPANGWWNNAGVPTFA